MGEYVKLNNLPISFPCLSVPKPTKKRTAPKYSCAIAFKQNDPQHMQELEKLKAVIEKVRMENNASEIPKLGPSKNDPSTTLANATAVPDYPPILRDAGNNEVDRMIAAQEFYPGAICNFVFDVYYMQNHDKVCLSVLGVQKMADGPRLDNRPNGDTLFSPQAQPAPQQQYQQPAPHQQYQQPAPQQQYQQPAPQQPAPQQQYQQPQQPAPQQNNQYGQPFPNATTPHDPLG